MNKTGQIRRLTDTMAIFISHVAKVLPDDVMKKLEQLSQAETQPLAALIYETMFKNQKLAAELNRPCCQDTGVLQFWIRCGAEFPLIGALEGALRDAVVQATLSSPLRHNSVETFDEYNTRMNVGKGVPTVFWDIIPEKPTVRSTSIWPVVVALYQVKRWFLCPVPVMKALYAFVLDQ